MKNNEQIFSDNKINRSTLKYFIIAFSVFIVLLAVSSAVLFMYSLDFDLDNIVDNNSTTESISYEELTSVEYSVNKLQGKSTLLLIFEKNDSDLDYFCTISTDYDKKVMAVNCIGNNENMLFNGKSENVSDIYANEREIGIIKSILECSQINIDKYIIINENQLDDVLSLFNGFSINVQSDINYKSNDFNLLLKAGKQELSSDLTYKYLSISDVNIREKIICDIITSVLSPNYIEESEILFTAFVNLCHTDISIIDYSNSIDRITTYCHAEDKFLPKVYSEGDI